MSDIVLRGPFVDSVAFNDGVKPSKNILKKIQNDPEFLSGETVHLENLVFKKHLVPDDPALIVQLGSKASIHAALSLPSSPIGPGPTQIASTTLFRNWIIAQVHANPNIPVTRRVQGPNTLAWHHLNDTEHYDILLQRWYFPAWLGEIRAANYAEPVAIVLVATGEGRGRVNLVDGGTFS